MSNLTFQPFSSSIDIIFWKTFSDKKLEVFKLSDKPVDILGRYACGPTFEGQLPALTIDGQSFESELKFLFCIFIFVL